MGLVTLPRSREGFRGAHRGEDVYVLASGASLGYFTPEEFAGKVCVCVNNVGAVFGLDSYYTVTHYHLDAVRNAQWRPDLPVIAPVDDLGAGGPEEYQGELPNLPNLYRFPTNPQMFAEFDVDEHWPTDPGALVAGPTSLHMTMHFAHWLGARTIWLVGADCGLIDGRSNLGGYKVGDNPMPVWEATLPAVANRLRALGSGVHSLNPWVNFGLEGHTYRSPRTSVNA